MASKQETIARLDEIGKTLNPCGFHQVDGKTKCVGKANDFTPCCSGCKFLKSNGCSVESVACKFYFCKWSWERLPDQIQDEIIKLAEEYSDKKALRFRFDGDRLTKDTIIQAFGHVPFRIYD